MSAAGNLVSLSGIGGFGILGLTWGLGPGESSSTAIGAAFAIHLQNPQAALAYPPLAAEFTAHCVSSAGRDLQRSAEIRTRSVTSFIQQKSPGGEMTWKRVSATVTKAEPSGSTPSASPSGNVSTVVASNDGDEEP